MAATRGVHIHEKNQLFSFILTLLILIMCASGVKKLPHDEGKRLDLDPLLFLLFFESFFFFFSDKIACLNRV